MSVSITKGQGYWRDGDKEVFNVNKDWLVWNWKDGCGHYFHGKREALRFIKALDDSRLTK